MKIAVSSTGPGLHDSWTPGSAAAAITSSTTRARLARVKRKYRRDALNHARDGYRAYRSRRKRGLRRHGAHWRKAAALLKGQGQNLPGSVRTGEIRHRRFQKGQTGRESLIQTKPHPCSRRWGSCIS